MRVRTLWNCIPTFFLAISFGSPTLLAKDSCGKLKPLPEREFVPFENINPETGKTYEVGDQINFSLDDGTAYKANAISYFAHINRIEKELNQLGYSMRDADLSSRDFQECYQAISLPSAELLELYSSPGALLSEDEEDEIGLPDHPELAEPDLVIDRAPLEAKLIKEWTLEFGSPDKFYTGVFPYINIHASDIEAMLNAGAAWRAAVLGRLDLELAHVAVDARSPGSAPLKANIDVFVLNGQRVWTKPLAGMAPIEYKDKYTQMFSKHFDYPFVIGPVPAKARLGVRGEAGLKWQVNLVPLQAQAFTIPWAGADVFAQVGGDLMGIAGAGVSGRLVLLKDSLVVDGKTLFEHNGKAKITLNANVNNKLTALSGELAAFMYMLRPTTEPPFYTKFFMEFPLYKHDGIVMENEIYSFNHSITP